MRVVVPHTGVSVETLTALDGSGYAYELEPVHGSDEDYWHLLRALWREGRDFAIVEQDIVVNPGTLADFDRCPYDWCAAPYPYLNSDRYAGSGCVRFRTALIAKHPDLLDVAGEYQDDRHTKGHWCSLDSALQRELHRRRVTRCIQHEPVGHLHTVPSHGCIEGYR